MKQQQGADKESVLAFVKQQYQTKPEYLFRKSPQSAVLRHGNGKWYGILMRIPREKLGGSDTEQVDILNIKCDPMMAGSMCMQPGFFPAYHMNKKSWLTVLLDGSVPQQQVFAALQMSYALVAEKSGKSARTAPKDWLIPANPKYENIAESFAKDKEIFWKQSGKFIPGDMIYIYEGKPIGAVTFACEVLATDIPYHYDQGGLHMDTVIRMELRKCFAREEFPLERLRDFGVMSVRGPRGIPADLLAALHAGGSAVPTAVDLKSYENAEKDFNIGF